MNRIKTLFPGAMGPDGFISCFDDLLPEDRLLRRIVLKGGPGVGKSTFMRRIHAALCNDGSPSTLCFCSGDPDSLDAVVIEEAGVILLDGTAPHIVDPRIPGARDSLVNLGECLDEEAMRPRLPAIRAVMADHAALSRRAVASLQAARAIAADNAAIVDAALDMPRAERLTRALIDAALDAGRARQEESPAVRRIIADAVTPKGEMSLIAENAPSRVIRLLGHPAQDLTPVLRRVVQAASANGLSVQTYLNPRLPGSLLHVGLPALDTLITTSCVPPSQMSFDLCSCLPQAALLRSECLLEQGMADVRKQLGRAVDALKAAKAAHDELETFYVPQMDFDRWQKLYDRTLRSLGA